MVTISDIIQDVLSADVARATVNRFKDGASLNGKVQTTLSQYGFEVSLLRITYRLKALMVCRLTQIPAFSG